MAAHVSDLAAARGGVVLEGVCVADFGANIAGGDRQDFGRDLLEQRMRAGTDVGHGGQDRELAVGRGGDLRIGDPRAADVTERYADAESGAARSLLAPPRLLGRG